MGTRLYVSNLPLSTAEEGLTTRFHELGAVLAVAVDAMVRAMVPGVRRRHEPNGIAV